MIKYIFLGKGGNVTQIGEYASFLTPRSMQALLLQGFPSIYEEAGGEFDCSIQPNMVAVITAAQNLQLDIEEEESEEREYRRASLEYMKRQTEALENIAKILKKK